MKIYYSNMTDLENLGFENLLPKEMKIGILVSYYGLKKLIKKIYCDHLFLDSGAFSAFKKNITINVYDFIKFINKTFVKPDVCCSLDDIKSFEVSRSNFLTMKKEGLEVIPCFHIGEPFEILEEYVKEPYVALGGIAFRRKKERSAWLDIVFSKYPNHQFHGFGIQDRNILLRYPWKSIDSSSVHVMARYGGISSPWGDYKINPQVASKDLIWITPQTIGKIEEWFDSLDLPFSFEEARENSVMGKAKRVAISVVYYETEIVPKAVSTFEKKNIGFGL